MQRSCDVDGVRVGFDEELGDGDPIVCLHAVGHDAQDFAPLRARLRGRRVLALDWPGHGRSSPDREPPSAARYERLLDRFLDAADVERAVIVGNSLGGAAALRYAAARPERVGGLVLVDPGGLDPGGAVGRAVIAMMRRFFAAGARKARWFPTVFRWYYQTVLRAEAAAWQRARIVEAAYARAALLRDAWAGFADPAFDLRPLVERVSCRVLVAWARADWVNQLGRCRPALARFRDAELVTFDGGHAPHLEAPDAFASALGAYLASLPAR